MLGGADLFDIQRQRCIQILCPEDPDFYTPLALNCQKGQHLPAQEVYKISLPKTLRFCFCLWKATKTQCGSSPCSLHTLKVCWCAVQDSSGKKKAHTLLAHKLLEKPVNPATTSRLTRRKCIFSWVRRRTHKLFCPVNRTLTSAKSLCLCAFFSSLWRPAL